MRHEGVLHTALSCDDILCNILLRLPPESIPKLIIVSKRCLHLICSSSFRHNLKAVLVAPVPNLLFHCCLLVESDDLKFSGILKKLGYFIDSSDGFLLCGRHPKTYFDCSCECESRFEEINVVTIETFSSKTSTWCYSKLKCASTISLSPWISGTVIVGVIHWYAAQGNIAIYDPDHHDKHIALVKLPGPFDFDAQVVGESSDGCLQYGWSCKAGLQIWVLEKGLDGYSSLFSTDKQSNLSWSMRYKLNFRLMWKKNPSLVTKCITRSKETEIMAFSPQSSETVFIRSGSNIFLYHFKSDRLEVIQYQGRGSSILSDFSKVVPYYKRAWPQSVSCGNGNGAT
ncbi:Myosin family protein with Dil domain [Hibiscus syriacus]|uniref:Myosin family protein with Dil domain n=1 Tax=Hibiscus syriacus TaxID=106335 RepID=A0A6A3B3R5_HIBSY|nr:Myosin family protein with Dil domain [Hibiscus syriacus]